MHVIRNTSTVKAASSNYKVRSRIFKNLLPKFEAHQNSRIRKKKKPFVEIIDQIHINRCSKDRLSVKHGNPSYADWELLTTVDPADSKMKELCKTFPVPQIARLGRNGARTWTRDRRTTESCRMQSCKIAS